MSKKSKPTKGKKEEEKKEELDKVEKENLEEKVEIVKPKPKSIILCPFCKIPSEYCEFKEEWTKCREWMEKNAPEVLQGILDSKEKDKLNNKETKTLKVKKEKEEKEKKPKEVIVKITSRTKRKTLSLIYGLETYKDFNAKKAVTIFKKAFACGAAIKEGLPGAEPDAIEVQGDIRDRVYEVLEKEWKVPENQIRIIEDLKKKKDEEEEEESDSEEGEIEYYVKPKKKPVEEKKEEKKPGDKKVGEKKTVTFGDEKKKTIDDVEKKPKKTTIDDVEKKPKKSTGDDVEKKTKKTSTGDDVEKKPKKEGTEKKETKKKPKKEETSSSESEEEIKPLNQKKEKAQKFGPKKEIIEVDKKKIDFGPKKREQKVCAFFNTERGCKQGNECPFAHIVGKSGEMPKKKVDVVAK